MFKKQTKTQNRKSINTFEKITLPENFGNQILKLELELEMLEEKIEKNEIYKLLQLYTVLLIYINK